MAYIDRPTIQPVSASTLGVGTLAHRSAREASSFARSAFDIPAVPRLPHRSPAETALARVAQCLSGITIGQYGAIAVCADRVDIAPDGPSLVGDGFEGMRVFLDDAAADPAFGPLVAVESMGPLSLAAALVRAGVAIDRALAVAGQGVRVHLGALVDTIVAALPSVVPIVIIDEPIVADLLDEGFPIAADEAIDLLSSAMAAVEDRALVAVQCPSVADWEVALASGPDVLVASAPASSGAGAPALQRFFDGGGWVAWGVVPTGGPVGRGAHRIFDDLMRSWCELVDRGVDPVAVRERCLITCAGDLGSYTPELSARLAETVGDVARLVRSQAVSTRFTLGA